MDLNSLKDTVANLSLYDIKAGVRKVQNGMLCCRQTGILCTDTPSQPS